MTSNVIPLKEPEPADPKCSFCGTPQSQAKRFISNSDGTKHICGECVTKAKQRLQEAA